MYECYHQSYYFDHSHSWWYWLWYVSWCRHRKIVGSTFSFLTNGLKSEETLNNTKSVLSSAAQTASSAIDTATNSVTSTKDYNNYTPFSFSGNKQFENGEFDSLGRATFWSYSIKLFR